MKGPIGMTQSLMLLNISSSGGKLLGTAFSKKFHEQVFSILYAVLYPNERTFFLLCVLMHLSKRQQNKTKKARYLGPARTI